MPANLISRMRRAREIEIKVGHLTFTVLRPTDADLLDLMDKDLVALARRQVIGWAGVTEADLVPGGSAADIPFDAALWQEWIPDRADLWTPIGSAVRDSYKDHVDRLESATKN